MCIKMIQLGGYRLNTLNKQTYKGYQSYPERIIQFGEGNFLRAFTDWQIDKMNKEANFQSGIVVVQPVESGLVSMLNDQDGLYTLYLQGMKNGEAVREHEVMNAITRGINPYTEHGEYMKLADNPEMRFIISNTTEAGITFDENDKLEDAPQKSFPGKLTALMYRRFKVFNGDKGKGFIIIPCELIDRNGDKLKEIILQYVSLWNLEPGFADWVKEANTFCCTLVDRIVPGYPKDSIHEITEELGYKDNLVVVGEQFHLWIIEGPQWLKEEFPAQKIGLNTLVVDDMTPYRVRKVRILNGAHTAMTPVAYLYGLDTVGESVKNDIIGRFVKGLIDDEIIPTLDLPIDELKAFANDTMDRFSNPFIAHYLMSIALNSISKFETRDLPTLLEYVNRKGTLPEKLVFSLSSLIWFYKGKRSEEDIELVDDQPVLDFFKSTWTKYDGTAESLHNVVETVLGLEDLWKMDLNKISGLTDLVTKYIAAIEKSGMQEAIKEVM